MFLGVSGVSSVRFNCKHVHHCTQILGSLPLPCHCLAVAQVNFESLPEGPDNPCGNGFVAKETPLLREREAQRTNNAASGRFWKVKNPAVINPTTGTHDAEG